MIYAGYPMGPLRVWLQSSAIPGLAMTRSIGDLVASQIGVTWEPEVTGTAWETQST